MSQSKLVLVTGATGNQGGAVVQALLAQGHQVRALTRNSASPAAQRLSEQGVEIATGDFTDHDDNGPLFLSAFPPDGIIPDGTVISVSVTAEPLSALGLTVSYELNLLASP